MMSKRKKVGQIWTQIMRMISICDSLVVRYVRVGVLVRWYKLLVSDEVPTDVVVWLIDRSGPAGVHHHGNLAAVHSVQADSHVHPLVHRHSHIPRERMGESCIFIGNHSDTVGSLTSW